MYCAFFTPSDKRRRAQDYLAGSAQKWRVLNPTDEGALPAPAQRYLDTALREHFLWADSLATYYSDRYRGIFILNYLLGSIAVLFALLSAPFAALPKCFHGFAWGELLVILCLAGLTIYGIAQDVHRRWLDYRLLAERLRHWAMQAPAGGTVFYFEPPYWERHQDNEVYAWVNWHIRALQRNAGLISAKLNSEYIQVYQKLLMNEATNQCQYHEDNAQYNGRIAAILHGTEACLLLGVFIACLVHIFSTSSGQAIQTWATIMAAVLPAFGAAAAGLLSQGEFERIAKRSQGMAKRLRELIKKMQPNTVLPAETLLEQAGDAIDVMTEELSGWRTIFREKILEMR